MSKTNKSDISFATNLASWSGAFSAASHKNLTSTAQTITDALKVNTQKSRAAALKIVDKIIANAPKYQPGLEDVVLENIPTVIGTHKDLLISSNFDDRSLDAVAVSITTKITKDEQEKTSQRLRSSRQFSESQGSRKDSGSSAFMGVPKLDFSALNRDDKSQASSRSSSPGSSRNILGDNDTSLPSSPGSTPRGVSPVRKRGASAIDPNEI